MNNFIIGPKLGDFFHSLYAVKCLSTEKKSNVYIKKQNGEFFANGLENTYNDIYSVVKKQPYIDNFLIYDNNVDGIIINHFDMDYLFKKNWYEVFENAVEYKLINKYENEPWLYEINNEEYNIYKDKIIIHFSKNRYNNNYDNILEDILKNNDCIFISCDESEYENFKFNNLVKFNKCKNFTELYSIIEKCKFFIGNQSMPLVIAHGLFKSHLGFLYGIDAIHYKENFNKNYFWIDDNKNTSENFYNINNHIKINNLEIIPENINLNAINITISYDKEYNKIFIACNLKITLYIIIYEYDIINNKKHLMYASLTEFNNHQQWYSFYKNLNDIQHIKVEIRYNEITLEDKLLY